MARIQFPSIPTKVLSESISSAASSFKLNNILDWSGTDLTSAAFGTIAFAVFKNADGTKIEIMRIDPSTIASASITIVKRGLSYGAADYDTEITANKLDWNANETYVELGSNPPQLYNEFVRKKDTETIEAVHTYLNTTRPKLDTDIDTTADEEFVSKGELNRAALGTVTNSKLVVSGNAGETVAAGNLLYLDSADTEWKKCDADTAASVENIILGIAQGAGTDGAAITGGILIRGVDAHQTGLTLNSVYYASNTAGQISATPGTKEVTVGISKSATELYFDPRYNQQITEDQQDALAGTAGTPSASNKYVTNDDTATSGASKVLRLDASGNLPALSGVNLTNLLLSAAGAKAAQSMTGATTPVPVCLMNDLEQLDYDATALEFGRVSTNLVKIAFKVIPTQATTVSAVVVRLRTQGTPTDNVYMTIEGDSGGSPDGTPITNGTSADLAAGDIAAAFGAETLSFAGNPVLAAGTTYWFVLQRDSTLSDTNYYEADSKANGSYGNFDTKTYTTSWGDTTSQLYFDITATGYDGFSYYKADGNDLHLNLFLGFVNATVAIGDTVTLIANGIVSGFTGLTTGAKYYVQDTAGTIGTTNGTYDILVGIAISTTQLVILQGSMQYLGSSSLSGAASGSTITVPALAKYIMINASVSSDLTHAGNIFLAKVGKTSGSAEGLHDYAGSYKTLSVSASWSGLTLTMTCASGGSAPTLSCTAYFYR